MRDEVLRRCQGSSSILPLSRSSPTPTAVRRLVRRRKSAALVAMLSLSLSLMSLPVSSTTTSEDDADSTFDLEQIGIGQPPAAPPSSRAPRIRKKDQKRRKNRRPQPVRSSQQQQGRDWVLHRLDKNVYPLARCLDGTQGVYYVRRGAQPRKVVIQLEGGGWCSPGGAGTCTKAPTCKQRAAHKYGLGSTRNDKTGADMRQYRDQGWMSTDGALNPAFFQWTTVFIRYCDGASFLGRRISPIPGNNGRPLLSRGNFILEAVIKELRKPGAPLYNPSHVVVRGSSAGGLAALLHVHRFQQVLPKRVRMAVISNGGFFPQWDVGNPRCDSSYGSYMKRVYQYSNAHGALPKSCIAAKSPTKRYYQCLVAEHIIPHVKVPVLVINSRYDEWQIKSILGFTYQSYSDVLQIYGKLVSNRAIKAIKEQNRRRPGPASTVFLHSCSVHVPTSDEDYGGINAAGVTVRQALMRFVARTLYRETAYKLESWISSAPYPCQKCCSMYDPKRI